MLIVSGQKAGVDDERYLHRGIPGQAFQRRFELADHVNGLLTIDLRRELPEEMKPRRIEIGTGKVLPKGEPKAVETAKQAA